MTVAKFKPKGYKGTVEIDRETSMFRVRPAYSRKEYTLPLGTLAEIVVSKVIKSDLADQGIAVPLARKGRQR